MQHSEWASTIVVGTKRVFSRGKWCAVEVLACPVTWRPHPEQIASARRGYGDWWQALDWVRNGLMAGRMLRKIEVTEAMPKLRPWGKGDIDALGGKRFDGGTARQLFVRIMPAKVATNARRFLRDLNLACPIRITKILTDMEKSSPIRSWLHGHPPLRGAMSPTSSARS